MNPTKKVDLQELVLSPFLEYSKYCDHNEYLIQDLAHDLTKNSDSIPEKSTRLFDWVQNNIKYVLGLYPDKATETIQKGFGSCSNKANVLVALLRASNIPAGFHIMKVHTRKYFGQVCTNRFGKFMSPQSIHIFGCVQIDGEWFKCDPTDDLQFSFSTEHFNSPSKPIRFNGNHNAMLNFEPDHIIHESDRAPSIDQIFEKSRSVSGPALDVMNSYVEFLRTHAKVFNSVQTSERVFFDWLENNRPNLYKAFLTEEMKLDAKISIKQERTSVEERTNGHAEAH